MQNATAKKIIQAVMIVVAAALNVWGILSLLQTLGLDAGLPYFDAFPNLVLNYVVVIATMACGIMLMSAAAATFGGKVKSVFSVVVCAYSTVMTVPLLLAFVLMIPAAAGASLPAFLQDMVGDIVTAFQIFLGEGGVQYLIYCLGILMSVVFLAVPIASTYCTVKDIDLIKLVKEKLSKNKSSQHKTSEDAPKDAQ